MIYKGMGTAVIQYIFSKTCVGLDLTQAGYNLWVPAINQELCRTGPCSQPVSINQVIVKPHMLSSIVLNSRLAGVINFKIFWYKEVDADNYVR